MRTQVPLPLMSSPTSVYWTNLPPQTGTSVSFILPSFTRAPTIPGPHPVPFRNPPYLRPREPMLRELGTPGNIPSYSNAPRIQSTAPSTFRPSQQDNHPYIKPKPPTFPDRRISAADPWLTDKRRISGPRSAEQSYTPPRLPAPESAAPKLLKPHPTAQPLYNPLGTISEPQHLPGDVPPYRRPLQPNVDEQWSTPAEVPRYTTPKWRTEGPAFRTPRWKDGRPYVRPQSSPTGGTPRTIYVTPRQETDNPRVSPSHSTPQHPPYSPPSTSARLPWLLEPDLTTQSDNVYIRPSAPALNIPDNDIDSFTMTVDPNSCTSERCEGSHATLNTGLGEYDESGAWVPMK
ncbi:uncharacterized protein LOC142588680 [Dermacentor variabilis]|uniref:uncharacterized protein LOC142588680 n=1 Tax=Dermacentor variabilis TaxID=34621 RepID=UPI003F5BA17D